MKRERIIRQPRLGLLGGAALTVTVAVMLGVAVVTGGAGLAGARATVSARGGAPSVAAAPAQNVITTLDTATTTSVQATIGSDGLPVIAYLTGAVQPDGTPIDPRTLKLAHCGDTACTAASIVTVATDAGQQAGFDVTNSFPHTVIGIAVGTDGFPLITYYKWDTKDLAVVHCTNVTCSTRATRVIASTGEVGRDSSVTIGPAIHPRPNQPELPVIPAGPVIAYYNATAGTLQVTRCSDPGCGGTRTTKTLDTVGDSGALTSIATSVDGTPIIAYRAVTDAGATWQLRTVYCATDILTATTKFCNQPAKTTLDSQPTGPGNPGNFFATSIVIGSDGLPFIGYGFVAHCSNLRCTAATLSDPGGPQAQAQISMAHSVAVGSDHLPMFAGPFPAGPAPARFIHCVSVTCPAAVAGEVGKTNWDYPSVTLGADGLPFIAFASGLSVTPPTQGLSVAHCANEFCASLFRRR